MTCSVTELNEAVRKAVEGARQSVCPACIQRILMSHVIDNLGYLEVNFHAMAINMLAQALYVDKTEMATAMRGNGEPEPSKVKPKLRVVKPESEE